MAKKFKSPKPRKTSPQPFNLLTEKRARETSTDTNSEIKEESVSFKAREMPEYNFFSVKKSEHSPVNYKGNGFFFLPIQSVYHYKYINILNKTIAPERI